MKKKYAKGIAAVFAQRKQNKKQVKSASNFKEYAQRQDIRSADSYYEWSQKEHSPADTIKGIYALAMYGSYDALEWLIDEAYGKSRISHEKGKRKALRKKARKYLSAVAVHPHLSAMEAHLGWSWLITLGDYHFGLFGEVKNSNLAWASRYYAMALAKKEDAQLKLKFQCVQLLLCQLTENDFKALVKHVGEYDFVTYAVAIFYLGLMESKKKKRGKHFRYYKTKVIYCLNILQYTEGRYIDNLFKAVLKSKLFK